MYPEMTCPRCGHEEPDYDGFGMKHCPKCHWCSHAAIIDGVCQFCGEHRMLFSKVNNPDNWDIEQ